MKKTIGVISAYSYIVDHINYGSLLQYYALQYYLKKEGFDIYWIRYRGAKTLKGEIRKKVKKVVFFNREKEVTKIHKSFMNFCECYLEVSQNEYRTYMELVTICPKADVYITGSDQVWGGTDENNYLNFVPAAKKKVSYAASFGVAEISAEKESVIKPWLETFDLVTVREKSGVEICNKMGIRAQNVLDPTLLIEAEEYPVSKCKYSEMKYVLSYFVNLNSDYNEQFNMISKYAERKKLDCYIIGTEKRLKNTPKKMKEIFVNPLEWLSVFQSAEYIFTNSFHGVIFSIIFRKRFLFIEQKGKTALQNERVQSVLKNLNLESRIYDPNKRVDSQISLDINWKNVEINLDEERKKTKSIFLEKIRVM